ncbi:TPA: type 1 fimbrial protein [Escherichia coli]|nr:fimbrial protein [Escherichia coli]EFL4056002.1 type 1 fimbrial protein [Escherichia coli]EFN4330283.1 type 1 fimbrial protein [Escherichia coli]EGO4295006.1 type 1 fimbrial protein [Escherichia coli]EHR8527494.1 type 1 fimbrial protein [Escherichia coli]
MSLKKILISASFFYSCFCDAEIIEDSSPEVKFSVTVEAPRCIVDWPGSIDFGDFDIVRLSRGVEKHFYITFSDCDSTSATIKFSGNNVDYNNNYIRNNTGGDYASNVAIKLFAYDRQEIDLSKGWTIVTDTSVSHTFRSIYYAKVFKIHEHATPGKIDSFVDLQVIYN